MKKDIDYRSSVAELGKLTRQELLFKGGVMRTFSGIQSHLIRENIFLFLPTNDGRTLTVEKSNLLMAEVFAEDGTDPQNEDRFEGTWILHFVGNVKRTFDVLTSTEKHGEMIKVRTMYGSMLIINRANLLLVECLP